MPRVHRRVAAKDYPGDGIAKGQTYWTWRMRTARSGITRRSATPPKPEQLTTSEYAQTWLPLNREVGAFAGEPDDLEELIERARALGEEQHERLENMPEGLQTGPAGELLSERASECEALADALEGERGTAEDLESGDADALARWHEEVQQCAQ